MAGAKMTKSSYERLSDSYSLKNRENAMHCGNPKYDLCNSLEQRKAESAIDPSYFRKLNESWTAKAEMRIETEMLDMLSRAIGASLSSPPTKKPEEKPMSSNFQPVLSELRRLHSDGADLTPISSEIKALQDKTKAEIADALDGVARAATLGKPKGQRFIIAYWKDGEAHTLEGTDYARGKYIDEKDEGKEYRVYVHEADFIFTDKFYSMARLERMLNERNITHVIDYFDKA